MMAKVARRPKDQKLSVYLIHTRLGVQGAIVGALTLAMLAETFKYGRSRTNSNFFSASLFVPVQQAVPDGEEEGRLGGGADDAGGGGGRGLFKEKISTGSVTVPAPQKDVLRCNSRADIGQ